MPNTADFHLWIQHPAQLLRQRHWDEVDVEHLIEAVENLGKSERRAIASQLTRLMLHLLKWRLLGTGNPSPLSTVKYQPQRRSDSWLDSITDARTQIELVIADSPSLKNYAAEQLEQSYRRARQQAAKQTGLSLATFSEACLSLELVLNEDWLPE